MSPPKGVLGSCEGGRAWKRGLDRWSGEGELLGWSLIRRPVPDRKGGFVQREGDALTQGDPISEPREAWAARRRGRSPQRVSPAAPGRSQRCGPSPGPGPRREPLRLSRLLSGALRRRPEHADTRVRGHGKRACQTEFLKGKGTPSVTAATPKGATDAEMPLKATAEDGAPQRDDDGFLDDGDGTPKASAFGGKNCPSGIPYLEK